MDWLADWWDGLELWVTQLWFPFQIALVIVLLLPACWWAARLIDVGVDRISAMVARRRLGANGTGARNGASGAGSNGAGGVNGANGVTGANGVNGVNGTGGRQPR